MLIQPSIFRLNPIWPCCIIPFMCSWILFTNILIYFHQCSYVTLAYKFPSCLVSVWKLCQPHKMNSSVFSFFLFSGRVWVSLFFLWKIVIYTLCLMFFFWEDVKLLLNLFIGSRSISSWVNFGKLSFSRTYLVYLWFQWYCIILLYLCCIYRNRLPFTVKIICVSFPFFLILEDIYLYFQKLSLILLIISFVFTFVCFCCILLNVCSSLIVLCYFLWNYFPLFLNKISYVVRS